MASAPVHTAHRDPVEAAPVSRAEFGSSVALVHDIMRMGDSLPQEFASCDVLYSILPWERGFETFNQRADIADGRTFDRFLGAVADIIRSERRPMALVTGRSALRYLPTPAYVVEIRLPYLGGQAALTGCWNMDRPPDDWLTPTALLDDLATEFDCVGDFCCGYGDAARVFAQAGKRFVASDLNPKCIGYIAAHAGEWNCQ